MAEAGQVTAADVSEMTQGEDAPGTAKDEFEGIEAPEVPVVKPKARPKPTPKAEDDELEEPEAPPPPKPAPKPKPKLKVNGQELPVEDAVAKLQGLKPEELQKVLAAHENFREAALLREQARKERAEAQRVARENAELLARLKDPTQAEKLLQEQMGEGLDKIVAQRYAKKFERNVMDPKDREILEAKERIAEFEAREVARQEKEKQAEIARQDAKLAEAAEKELIQVADLAGLPNTPEALSTLADVALEFLSAGIKYTPDMLAREVKDRFQNPQTSRLMNLLLTLEDDTLLTYAPDLAKKFHKALLGEQKRKRSAGTAAKPTGPKVRTPAEDVEVKTEAQLKRELRAAGLL